jgi:ParB-like chromosome segregation protein Spo0J
MMKLSLSQVLPNPYRDFELDPIDDGAVAHLTSSLNDLEFWGGICVRKLPEPTDINPAQAQYWHTTSGTHELVYGHHRLKALLQADSYGPDAAADLNIVTYDDVTMAKAMAIENATQRKGIAAATDAVAAAIRALGYELLSKGFLKNFSETDIPKLKGRLLAGNGLGRDLLDKFFGGAVSRGDIQQAIGSLKKSGKMAEYLEEIQIKIAKDEAKAEAARVAAAAKAEEKAELLQTAQEAFDALVEAHGKDHPKTKTSAKALSKAKELATKADATVAAVQTQVDSIKEAHEDATTAAEKAAEQEVLLDPGLSALFGNQTYIYKTATGFMLEPLNRDWFPVDEQVAICSELIEHFDGLDNMTAEKAKTALANWKANGKQFIKEQEEKTDEEKNAVKVQKAADALEKAIRTIHTKAKILAPVIAKGVEVGFKYGNATFFEDTVPGLLNELDDLAASFEDGSSIVSNQ